MEAFARPVRKMCLSLCIQGN